LRAYFTNVLEVQTAVRRRYGRVLGCFHNSVGSECIHATPAIAAKVQEVISMRRRYLETTLRDAQAAGLVRHGDPATDAKTLFSFVEGALGQARIHDDLEILRQLPLTGMALIGVTVPEADSARSASV
jgi:TetR/AcrR family transcriptional repressor of nem operon